jgi:type II secretory pathway predicted ATPase ExeA
MYLDHFKLTDLPFRLSPDPAFLYPSPIHSRAKAYMESTIWFTDGFVVITGEIGSGKTTLIETFLREIEQNVVVAQLNQTQVTPTEFLQTLLAQFGFNPFKMRKAELLATLNNFLIEQYSNGRKVLLIVDEAQNLGLKVLEELRLLSGVETTREKVLRIILAGSPSSPRRSTRPSRAAAAARRLRFHLSALTEENTTEYVQHRPASPARAIASCSSAQRSRSSTAIPAGFRGSSTRCATRRCSPRLPRTSRLSRPRRSRQRSPSCSGASRPSARARSRRSTTRRDTCDRRSGRSCSRSTGRCSAKRCSCRAAS